jgi:hypothetical protein
VYCQPHTVCWSGKTTIAGAAPAGAAIGSISLTVGVHAVDIAASATINTVAEKEKAEGFIASSPGKN